MQEKIILDMLTQDSVSIKRQQYIISNDVEYLIGEPSRKAYVNSANGRMQVETEISEPYKSAIMIIWGNDATVDL